MPDNKSRCCIAYTLSPDHNLPEQPNDCPGILATGYTDWPGEEGYYIEVCPRKSWLGKAAGGIAFCGLGPDVIILHRDTSPTQAEYEQAAREADLDW